MRYYSCWSLLTWYRFDCWSWDERFHSVILLQRFLSFLEKKHSTAFLMDAGKISKHIPRLLLLCYCIASCDPLSSQQCTDFRLHRLGGIYFRARLYLAVMSTAANYKKLGNALWKCNSCCSTWSLVYYKSALLHVHTTKIKYNSNHYIVQGIWDTISPETRRNSRLDKLSNFARSANREIILSGFAELTWLFTTHRLCSISDPYTVKTEQQTFLWAALLGVVHTHLQTAWGKSIDMLPNI